MTASVAQRPLILAFFYSAGDLLIEGVKKVVDFVFTKWGLGLIGLTVGIGACLGVFPSFFFLGFGLVITSGALLLSEAQEKSQQSVTVQTVIESAKQPGQVGAVIDRLTPGLERKKILTRALLKGIQDHLPNVVEELLLTKAYRFCPRLMARALKKADELQFAEERAFIEREIDAQIFAIGRIVISQNKFELLQCIVDHLPPGKDSLRKRAYDQAVRAGCPRAAAILKPKDC